MGGTEREQDGQKKIVSSRLNLNRTKSREKDTFLPWRQGSRPAGFEEAVSLLFLGLHQMWPLLPPFGIGDSLLHGLSMSGYEVLSREPSHTGSCVTFHTPQWESSHVSGDSLHLVSEQTCR